MVLRMDIRFRDRAVIPASASMKKKCPVVLTQRGTGETPWNRAAWVYWNLYEAPIE
jgi:hypothetical protein